MIENFHSPGVHLTLDAAITCPAGAVALRAGSANEVGVAAELRATKKFDKYLAIASADGHSFKAAVMERFGACCDSLSGFIKLIGGDGDRDWRESDYNFSGRSRSTWAAQHIIFAGVLADAAMVVDVMDADAHGCSLGDAGARGDGHARGGGRKGGGQREYGGAFGYERGV